MQIAILKILLVYFIFHLCCSATVNDFVELSSTVSLKPFVSKEKDLFLGINIGNMSLKPVCINKNSLINKLICDIDINYETPNGIDSKSLSFSPYYTGKSFLAVEPVKISKACNASFDLSYLTKDFFKVVASFISQNNLTITSIKKIEIILGFKCLIISDKKESIYFYSEKIDIPINEFKEKFNSYLKRELKMPNFILE